MTKSLCLVVLVALSSSSLMAKEAVGKISAVTGEAYIAHLLKKKKPAVVGEPVFEKDKIKTGKDGKVVVTMLDETKLTVSPGSYMKIPKKVGGGQAKTELALFGGKVGFEVKPLGDQQTFTVRTPSAVAGVRGTHGEMSFDMNSGMTGAQSLPHTDGTNAKSVVCTLPIEQAGQIDNFTKGPAAGGPGGAMVVNEGQASFHMADGEAMLVDMKPGEDLSGKTEQVAAAIKEGKAVQQSKSRFAGMDADRVAQLELLEARLESIQTTVNKEIPGLNVDVPVIK